MQAPFLSPSRRGAMPCASQSSQGGGEEWRRKRPLKAGQPFWSRVKTACPIGKECRPRKSCCMSAVVHDGAMVLFGGGIIENYYDDIFRIDLDTHVWARLRPIGADAVPRTLSHTAVVHRGQMLVFGGMAKGRCHNACYSLALDARPLRWTTIEAATEPPAPRKGHQAYVWRDRMYVFMGADFQGFTTDDVHWLDLTTQCWHRVERRDGTEWPLSRTGHSVAVRRGADTLYLFGGMTKTHAGRSEWLGDLWAFHFPTSAWTRLQPQTPDCPAGRYSQISWVAGDKLLVFGGDTLECSEYFDDLWEFDLHSMVWRRLDIPGDRPSARSGHVGCAWRGTLYMFGGEKPRKAQAGADDESSVEYSNTLYQMHHYIAPNTSLRSIMARHVLSQGILPCDNREAFRRGCAQYRLPVALVSFIDAMRPRGKRPRRRPAPSSLRLAAGPPRQRLRLDAPPLTHTAVDSDYDSAETSAWQSASESAADEFPARSVSPPARDAQHAAAAAAADAFHAAVAPAFPPY